MEVKQQVEYVQIFSHQHASGEVFAAENIEVARGMCPVLGKMSVEEAGLLLELEAMGKEQLADKPELPGKVTPNKPIIERLANVEKHGKEPAPLDGHKEITPDLFPNDIQTKRLLEPETSLAFAVEPTEHNRSEDTNRVVLKADIQDVLAQQEVTNLAKIDAEIDHEVQRTVDIEEPQSAVVAKKPAAQRVKPEPALETAKPTFINRKDVVKEKDTIDVEQQTATITPVELLQENSWEQPEPEPALDLNNLVEAVETIDTQEHLRDYDLFEEDDVIELMNELMKNKVETDETSLLELLAADQAKIVMPRFMSDEFQTSISVPELPAPVKEIETAIVQLAEVLETETEVSQDVYKILEEIITLPNILETSSGEAERIIEQRLEELFVTLFDEAGVEYTPLLINSFTKLTQAHYLQELLEAATEDEHHGLPVEIGTREFLQKLQRGLSSMKQAVTYFYEIGKSALRLYILDGLSPQIVAK